MPPRVVKQEEKNVYKKLEVVEIAGWLSGESHLQAPSLVKVRTAFCDRGTYLPIIYATKRASKAGRGPEAERLWQNQTRQTFATLKDPDNPKATSLNPALLSGSHRPATNPTRSENSFAEKKKFIAQHKNIGLPPSIKNALRASASFSPSFLSRYVLRDLSLRPKTSIKMAEEVYDGAIGIDLGMSFCYFILLYGKSADLPVASISTIHVYLPPSRKSFTDSQFL